MGFRINTNIDAMTAHRNMLGTSGALGKSLERLSSGLRINRAADDASGMTIADSLRAQATGLGQAMRNAGDAISLVQVADGALEESINIVTTIRTKAIQAASDGQNAASRAAIQADIGKLLEEMNIIADTTAFNGQILLKGDFTNKSFQIGAYANQTVSVSIDSAAASQVGRLALADSTTVQAALVVLASDDIAAATATPDNTWAGPISTNVVVNGVNLGNTLTGQGSNQLSAKGVAIAFNAVNATTGVKATATNAWTGTGSVTAGTIADGELFINGVNIGAVDVSLNDATGTLAAAINKKTPDTGVTALVDASGIMTLTAADGRDIAATGAKVGLLGTGFADNTSRTMFTGDADTTAASTYQFSLDGVSFTTDATGTAAADEVAVYNALVAAKAAGKISSNYTFVDNANGVVITRTDGKDINFLRDTDDTGVGGVYKTGVDAAGAGGTIQANGAVYNASQHGVVSLTSTGNINISGDASTLATYGLKALAVTPGGGIAAADVLTAKAAQVTIQRADAALDALDKVRSGLGSSQNQVEATLRNISVTRVNIQAAESAIRDVDFADESSNFAKMNILVQAGSYALSQANAVQQNIMTLLR